MWESRFLKRIPCLIISLIVVISLVLIDVYVNCDVTYAVFDPVDSIAVVQGGLGYTMALMGNGYAV